MTNIIIIIFIILLLCIIYSCYCDKSKSKSIENFIDTIDLGAGLTHYYLFDRIDTSGNIFNYGSNRYDLKLNGASINNNSAPIGNSSLYFYNITATATANTMGVSNNGLTIASWYNVELNNTPDDIILFTLASPTYVFTYSVTGRISINNIYSNYFPELRIENTRTHIAFTYSYTPDVSESILIIYINGVISKHLKIMYPDIGSNYKIILGPSNNRRLLVSDFRMYNRSLKANEINNLWLNRNTTPISNYTLINRNITSLLIIPNNETPILNCNSSLVSVNNSECNGLYTVNSSSTGYGIPINIFKYYTKYDDRQNIYWKAGYKNSPSTFTQDSYDGNSPSRYIGGGSNDVRYYTIIDGLTISGEWIQIELPYQINIVSYSFSPYINWELSAMNKFYVAGSNNGNTWNRIDYKDLGNNLPTAKLLTYNISSNNFYSYIRLVVPEMMNNITQFALGKIYFCGFFNKVDTQTVNNTNLSVHYTFNNNSSNSLYKNEVTNNYDLQINNAGVNIFDHPNGQFFNPINALYINNNGYGLFNNLTITNNGLSIAFYVFYSPNIKQFVLFDFGNSSLGYNIIALCVFLPDKNLQQIKLRIYNNYEYYEKTIDLPFIQMYHFAWIMTPAPNQSSNNPMLFRPNQPINPMSSRPNQPSNGISNIYINGINVATFTNWIYPNTTIQRNRNYLGYSPTNIISTTINILDFRIYNRILTDKEVSYLALKRSYIPLPLQ